MHKNLGKMICFHAGKMIQWFCGKETAARALEGRGLVSVDNLHLEDIPNDVVDADISPLQQYTEKSSWKHLLQSGTAIHIFPPALNCHDIMFSPLQFMPSVMNGPVVPAHLSQTNRI